MSLDRKRFPDLGAIRQPLDRARPVLAIGWIAVLVGLGNPGELRAQAKEKEKEKVPASQAKADRIVAELVEGHNKERAKAGLGPLTLESRLVEAAKVHARDMAEHEVMTHDGSDGSNSAERVAKAGYHYLSTGENVAMGYRTVAEVIKVWIESPPHKKNILGDYTEIGVAVVYGEDNKPYWCTEFGKPLPKFEPVVATGDLVKLINDERAAAKKPPLTVDQRLVKVAKEQAEILSKDKTPEGGTANLDGINKKLFSETAMSTATGHADAPSLVKAFMEKPDMKAQLLGNYARMGTGYAVSEDGVAYWCLILANLGRR